MNIVTSIQADENPWIRRVMSGGWFLAGAGLEVAAILDVHENEVDAQTVTRALFGVGALVLGVMTDKVFRLPSRH